MATSTQDQTTTDTPERLDSRTGRLIGRTLVVKLGGSVRGEGTAIEDLAHLSRAGVRVVVIHGGGPQITDMLARLGAETRFVEGRRVTDDQAIDVAHMVLGHVNGTFVASFQGHGVRAVGLTGLDAGTLRARLRDPRLGHVGDVDQVDLGLVRLLLEQGYVPVIAPLATGPVGQPLNVNADSVAGEVARALGADEFVLCTDVPGVKGADGAVIHRLSRHDVQALIEAGVISGGMLPKVEACLRALDRVQRVRILDGRAPHAIMQALATDSVGTTLTQPATRRSPE